MEIVLLGTGGPPPDANRAGPATLVRAGGHQLLFDCGRAVVMRLTAANVFNLNGLTALFLTHLHSDHAWALNDVLTTRWVMQQADNPLRIYGPVGTTGFVERTLAAMRPDIDYRLDHHDDLNWEPTVSVTEVTDGVVFDENGVTVTAAPTDHGVVRPTVGYRIDGDGTSAAIAGDTLPCDGLDRLCAGAGAYVQTVIRPDLVQQIPMARLQDIIDYHSSVEDAGRTAAKAGVGKLVLTHMVPAPLPGSEDEWIAQAAAHFGGEVILGTDLLTIPV